MPTVKKIKKITHNFSPKKKWYLQNKKLNVHRKRVLTERSLNKHPKSSVLWQQQNACAVWDTINKLRGLPTIVPPVPELCKIHPKTIFDTKYIGLGLKIQNTFRLKDFQVQNTLKIQNTFKNFKNNFVLD